MSVGIAASVYADRARAIAYAQAASLLWLAGVRLDRRRAPRRRQPDAVVTYVVTPLNLAGRAVLGAAIGQVALQTRGVQHTMRRYEAYLAELESHRDRVEQAIASYIVALEDFRAARCGGRWGRLIGDAADRSQHRVLDVAITLAVARQAGSARCVSLDELALGTVAGDERVELVGSTGSVGLSCAGQAVVEKYLTRALCNARAHAPSQPVRLVLERSAADLVRIVISNPVQSPRDGPVTVGNGMADSCEEFRQLGGDVRLYRRAGCFYAEARCPAGALAAEAGSWSESGRQLERARSAIWQSARLCAVMVVAMAVASKEYVGPQRRRSQILAAGTVGAAHALHRFPWPGRRARLETIMGITAVSAVGSPHGRNPPLAGWAATVLGAHTLEGAPRRSFAAALALAASSIASYRGPRHDSRDGGLGGTRRGPGRDCRPTGVGRLPTARAARAPTDRSGHGA
jgi:hypothetical protein